MASVRQILGASLAVGAVLLCGVALQVQASRQNPRLVDILTEYRSGDADAAVARLASWPIARVYSEPVPVVETDPWGLAALILLYTEVGFANGMLGSPLPRPSGHFAIDVNVNYRSAEALAERLFEIAKLRNDTRLAEFVRRWVVVTSALQARNSWWWSLGDLEFANRHFSTDPEIQLVQGSKLIELSGPEVNDGPWGVSFRELVPQDRPTAILSTRHGNYSLERSREAEAALRAAIANAPELLEARLRLGWLLAVLDRPGESLRVLDETVALAERRGAAFEGYLAAMFMGWLHATRDDSMAAIEKYIQASAFMPEAPAAHLALGLARIDRGDRAGWAEIRDAITNTARPPVTDPWALFSDLQYWRIGELLPALRAMVRIIPAPLPASSTATGGRQSVAPIPPDTSRAVGTESPQGFRGVVEGVRIDVSVTDRGRAISGLSADDFEILDNGVVQRLGSAAAAGHLSIALALDTSTSVGHEFTDLKRAAVAVADGLRPGDRLSLLTFDDSLALAVYDATESQAVHDALARQHSRKRSKTVLWDALVGAASLVSDAPGRPLVIVLSDALDSASWVTLSPFASSPSRNQDRLFEQLRRAGIVVDTIWVAINLVDDEPNVRASYVDHAVGRIPKAELANATGGVALDGTKDLRDVIRRRFEELRQSYVLTYTPTGVKTGDGWHKVTVRLKAKRGQVRARSGYFSAPLR